MTTEVTMDNIVGENGAYPSLLAAVQADLQTEYDAGRLLGTDYANVYVALVQNALSQAIQFELTKAQVAAQTDLILAQIETQNQQTELVQAQIISIAKDDLLKDQQLAKLILDVNITQTQDEITTATKQDTIDLAAAQTDTAQVQLTLAEQQLSNLTAEGLNIPKQGILLDNQALDVVAGTLLKSTQNTNLEAEGLNIPKQGELLDGQVLQMTNQNLLTVAQTAKVEAETTVVIERGGFR